MCLCESDPIETSGVRETRERCVCIACIVLHSNILQPAPFPSCDPPACKVWASALAHVQMLSPRTCHPCT